ncbi:YfdQ family protein [Chenggangzhangella methanolivorans]|uniref:YfdQ family protein n=1 Tax=Chenggangzhangella methanolivorans TaxID=1437009 RepID=A0A9E6UKM7_9HYPH|nr:YfdQ family protein [Chenggangzhangella methanolivorans]QZN99521.1 YfdQ family protein [Chenggangzhangella methanolivorans]
MAQHSSNDLPTSSAVKDIAHLAQAAVDAQIIGVKTDGLGPGLPAEVPVLYDPKLHTASAIDHVIEAYRQAPRAREGTARILTAQSFVDLVNRHKDEGSAIFAETRWPNPKLLAVLDYHDVDGAPRHGRHRVEYAFPISEEFRAWHGQNGKPMEQAAFAAFLEEHAAELASPEDGEKSEYERIFKATFGNPNEILTLSRELEVTASYQVKNKVRLQTGETELNFVEEHNDRTGKPVVVPGIFMVSVPAFLDGDPVRIPARLRYRLEGAIKWSFHLYRWEYWLRERVQHDLERVSKDTGLPAFEGLPEAATGL